VLVSFGMGIHSSRRLWTQKELLEQLFAHYEYLVEDLRAELPLKRIWAVAAQGKD